MLINEIKPAPSLQEYIRLYRIIDFHFSNTVSVPLKMYSPRPEQCLQFYPKDTETVRYPASSLTVSNKRATITGQHTVLNHRQVGNDFLSFQVVFQPGAFFRLTGIPMQSLSNLYLDAEDILGKRVREVNERLFIAGSYHEMISIIDQFLATLVKQTKKQHHPVDDSGRLMLLEEEFFKVDNFIKQSCLSTRQFDRMFKERIGIAPKQYLQVVRFDKAFRMKNRHPHLDWLSIAIRCGYHDYQHLVKDYKAFTGYTPAQFFLIDNQAPERAFGDAEI
jgi:AraC-like DNA-binding protein